MLANFSGKIKFYCPFFKKSPYMGQKCWKIFPRKIKLKMQNYKNMFEKKQGFKSKNPVKK
jgi:hypothetical protein